MIYIISVYKYKHMYSCTAPFVRYRRPEVELGGYGDDHEVGLRPEVVASSSLDLRPLIYTLSP